MSAADKTTERTNAIISTCVVVAFNAFTLWVLWMWFVIPMGFVKLSFPQALGVELIAKHFKFRAKSTMTREEIINIVPEEDFDRVLFNCMTLGLGFIYHWFM